MSTVGGGVPVTIDQPYCIRSYHRAQLFVCCCTPEFIDIFGSVLSYFFVHLFFSKALHYNPGYRNMKRIEAKGLSALVAEMCVVWAENYKPASLYELRLYCSNINPSYCTSTPGTGTQNHHYLQMPCIIFGGCMQPDDRWEPCGNLRDAWWHRYSGYSEASKLIYPV